MGPTQTELGLAYGFMCPTSYGICLGGSLSKTLAQALLFFFFFFPVFILGLKVLPCENKLIASCDLILKSDANGKTYFNDHG